MGAWDHPFMGKETQAQRGQGVVLSHTAMCAKPIRNPSQPREEAAPMSPARSHPWKHFVTGSSVQTLLVVLICFSLLRWPVAWFPSVPELAVLAQSLSSPLCVGNQPGLGEVRLEGF